ncbi:hypothetical protein PHLGIDRAFT_244364 [Phlebiopsis gigantea 11061_1 CR5-6]|uniref:Uncharacterized protein n=1 Tax=Phlebiopsis gigantea (strain 11061_1 CR5-6) TaxID=745531 RepID=A0A0C3S1U3_PHLG1|nr:hypothetical protein PHLGIDRAFT_244364 [Phlebiopsis gigantea 11061_1 CR5-6]
MQTSSLIDSTPRLQYTLELLLAGMVDSNSNGSATSAFAKLRKLRRAWQEFRLSHQITLPCFHGRTPLACDYKVSAGVLGQQVGQRGLKFHLLSSSPWGIDAQEWDIEDLGFEVYHFVLDVAQDLLIATELQTEAVDVIVGMRVHLLSLHTGKPHPHAQVPVFTVDYSDNDGRIGVNAECCGDSLGVMVTTRFFDGICELLVWNWKTGQLRLDIYNMMYDAEPWLDKFIGANSFHFLDADHVLVPTIEENKGINSRAVLHMFDCREISPARKALRDLISCGTAFILPPLAQNFEYTQFDCAANIPPPLAPTSPFHPDPTLRMVVFQLGETVGSRCATSPTTQGLRHFACPRGQPQQVSRHGRPRGRARKRRLADSNYDL